MIAAIVPAAGHSQRMGRPKLILEIGGRTVIDRVVTALREGGATPVLVVAPPVDAAGASILHSEAIAAGGVLIVPETRPPEMRVSFEHALDRLEQADPVPSTLLLVPADSPGLNAALVALVVERARAEPEAIIVPVVGTQRGHPIALPWNLAIRIRELPAGVGINALVTLHASKVIELAVVDTGALSDLDTPEDYLRWESTGG